VIVLTMDAMVPVFFSALWAFTLLPRRLVASHI